MHGVGHDHVAKEPKLQRKALGRATSIEADRFARPTRNSPKPMQAQSGEAKAFWQRRFYDFNMWSRKKVLKKVEYMHDNPLKRGLVSHPKDWPWSSWSHYAVYKGAGFTLKRVHLLISEPTKRTILKSNPRVFPPP
jgi:hypothetical protein